MPESEKKQSQESTDEKVDELKAQLHYGEFAAFAERAIAAAEVSESLKPALTLALFKHLMEAERNRVMANMQMEIVQRQELLRIGRIGHTI